MSRRIADETAGAEIRTLIVVLERLVRMALGPEGAQTLVVRDGAWYRMVVSLPPGGSNVVLDPGARAVFSFTPERVRGLVELGVEAPDLAQSAFGELVEQLATQAPDKVAFMRAVHARLAAAHTEIAGGAS
jgi:hypothetical protein